MLVSTGQLTLTHVNDGRGIQSVVEQYYLSTSPSSEVGGSWVETSPPWEEGKYIFTRNKITYTDGEEKFTPAINSDRKSVV